MAEEKVTAVEETVEKKAPAKKAAAKKPAAEKKTTVKKTAAKTTTAKATKAAAAKTEEKAATKTAAKKPAAKKAPAKKAATSGLTVKLVKSLIGRSKKQIATANSLGLKKIGDVKVQPDNAATQGKINVVSHLVEVTKA